MDKYVLKMVGDTYCLVYEYEDNNQKGRKCTNDIEEIKKVINYLDFEHILANKVEINLNDRKLIFADQFEITLRNYDENKDLDLYKALYSCVDEKTKKVDLNKKRNNNKKAIKRVFSTSMVVVTLAATIVLSKKKNGNTGQVPTPTVTVDPTVKPTKTPTVTVKPTAIPTPTISNFDDILDPNAESTYEADCYERLSSAKLRRLNMLANNPDIPLSVGLDDSVCKCVKDVLDSATWTYFEKYGKQFSVDPYLLLAIGYKESSLNHEAALPNGRNYNGHAVGIMQHEHPENEEFITAFNYETNEEETVKKCMENAKNEETNIKMAAMILQNRMKKYNGNIYVVLQSYNYGESMMDKILKLYAESTKVSFEDVINNYSDFGWLTYVKDVHENPKKYKSDWEHKTYGDPNYFLKTLSFYIGEESVNLGINTNLITLEKKEQKTR